MRGCRDSLEVLVTRDVDDQSRNILAAIVNDEWSSQVKADADMIARRFRTGSTFLVAYELPTLDDLLFLRDKHRIHIHYDKIPVGMLETVSIRTSGEMDKVPCNYDLLTNRGYWRAPEPGADTLILVDITLLHSRRGGNGNGAAGRIVQLAKEIGQENYRYIWSFTPNIEKVKAWHMKQGARDTGFVIPNARPGYRVADVNMMDYSPRP